MEQHIGTILARQQDQIKEANEQTKRQNELITKISSILEAQIKTSSSTATTIHTNGSSIPKLPQESLMDSLTHNISEFFYDPSTNQTFSTWYQRHEDLFSEDAAQLDEKAKVRLLLRKFNPIVYNKYADYILPKNPRDLNFTETIDILNKIFGKTESTFSSRYKCLQTVKNDNDDFITYATIVNKRCEHFQLAKLSVDQLKCLIFVMGLQSSKDAEIRTKLLALLDNEKSSDLLNVDKLMAEIQRTVDLKKDSNLVGNSSQPKIFKINYPKSADFQNNKHANKNNYHKKPNTPCWYCGMLHFSRDCIYKNHKCNKCNQIGHRDGYCAPTIRKTSNPNQSSSHQNKPSYRNQKFKYATQSNSSVANIQQKNVHQIHSVNTILPTIVRKDIMVLINRYEVTLQIDTGSDVSIISKDLWRKIGSPQLANNNHHVIDASANKLNFQGYFTTEVQFQGKQIQSNIFVTELKNLNIFGNNLMQEFKLWDVPINQFCKHIALPDIEVAMTTIKNSFSNVFKKEVGHCNKFKVNLPLKPNVQPVFVPKRPVAYSVLPAVEQELQRLEDAGIISPVNYSQWAAPIVVVKKPNGKIRICSDYSTGLNERVEPHNYPLPIPEDIFAKMTNCKYFTIIDLSDAYMQVEVDDETKKILTINTHKGLFNFNRLSPGVKSAPGAFQLVMDKIFSDLNEVSPYIDDIIIATEDFHQNFNIVSKTLERLQNHNFTVNFEKCSFFQNKCKYLGHIIDQSGIKPDPKKLEAIQKLSSPTNINELRSFLGAVNYYSKFVKEMRQLRAPLDELLQHNKKWNWSATCEQSVQKFKEILSSDLQLTHYNPKLEIQVAADASIVGIGARVSHIFPDGCEKAIFHASRALTPSEKNYSQIEKEGLALVFAVKKFHKMIYGRKFTLLTDHKPLLTIFGSKKGIPVHTANRLQRWALILMSYNFEIKYVSTKEFGYVDVLSQLINNYPTPNEDFVVASTRIIDDELSSTLQENLKFCPITYNMVQKATLKDKTLQTVMNFIKNGWPDKTKISEELLPYYVRRNALIIIDNCVLYRERLVIPICFKIRLLKQLHKSHQGMNRMKSIARSYVYWPKIDCEIENYVKTCQQCASAVKNPSKVPLSTWQLTTKPLERIHIDIAGPMNAKYYLVVVDAYSKYPEITQTSSISSKIVVSIINEYCSRFGQPDLIVSDNGTQFTSHLFKQFCSERGIQHLTSPIYHPQSNGQAERFVDTFKRALTKLKEEGSDEENLQEFLQSYRSTQNKNTENGKTPAEMFLGRKIKTNMDLLKKSIESVNKKNLQMENQFNNQHRTKKRSFNQNDKIWYRMFSNNKYHWTPGKIINQIGNVMYTIELFVNKELSKTLKVHANQLLARFSDDPNPSFAESSSVEYLKSPSNNVSISNKNKVSINQQSQIEPRKSQRKRQRPKRFQD